MPAHASDFRVPADLAPRIAPVDASGARRGRFAAEELRALAGRVATRGPQVVAAIPVARRLALWNETLAAFLEPGSPERSALLPRLLTSARLSAEGLTEGLEIVLGGASGASAAALARRAGALADGLAGAAPRTLAGVVLAGNIPGLAVQSLLPALLLGRPLLLKSASAEPWFAPALVAALVAREPALADAYAAVAFTGDDAAAFTAAFADTDPLLAYGGAAAVTNLTAHFGGRLVAHGPKASVAFVGADVDLVGTARGLARDIALFDQRGCLSVQAVYTDGDPEELAAALAWALRLESARLPHGPIDAATAAAVQQLRAAADLKQGTKSELQLELAVGTVLVESATFFRPVPGLRTVRVHGVPKLTDALPALAAWRGQLQGAVLAGPTTEKLAASLPLLGFSRLAPPGELQSADASWANGGMDPLGVFSRSA
jgi:hypothetical protein